MSELVITILAVAAIAISTWGIIYFAGRIFTHYWIRRHLGDMPTSEEIEKLYAENNRVIGYLNHSPIRKKLQDE